MLDESIEANDKELKEMLEEELRKLRGDDDDYGEIEEL